MNENILDEDNLELEFDGDFGDEDEDEYDSCLSIRAEKMWESLTKLVGVTLTTFRGKEFIFEILTGQELMQKHSEKLESGRLKLGGEKINPTELYVVVGGIKAPVSKSTFIDAYCDVEGTQHGNFNSGNDVYKGLDGPGCIEHKGSTYIWAIFNELEIL